MCPSLSELARRYASHATHTRTEILPLALQLYLHLHAAQTVSLYRVLYSGQVRGGASECVNENNPARSTSSSSRSGTPGPQDSAESEYTEDWRLGGGGRHACCSGLVNQLGPVTHWHKYLLSHCPFFFFFLPETSPRSRPPRSLVPCEENSTLPSLSLLTEQACQRVSPCESPLYSTHTPACIYNLPAGTKKTEKGKIKKMNAPISEFWNQFGRPLPQRRGQDPLLPYLAVYCHVRKKRCVR